jgi:hypothetical protein
MPHLGPALDRPIPLSALLQVGHERSPDEAAVLSRKGEASWSELDAVANGLAANYLALWTEARRLGRCSGRPGRR